MDKQDWYDMGAQIGDLVQSAIDSNDFKQLNQSIADTINTTMNMVQKNVKDGTSQAKSRVGAGASWEQAAGYGKTWSQTGRTAFEQAMDRAGQAVEEAFEQAGKKEYGKYSSQTGRNQKGNVVTSKKNAVKTTGSYKGIAFMAVGYSFMGIFGLLFVLFLMISGAAGAFLIPTVLFLALTVGFLMMGLRGSSLNARVKRQKQYLQIMGGRDTCTLEELAAGTGKKKKYVAKDLREMIQDRMFPEGAYLDKKETCLMTSRTAYSQYQEAERQFEQRKAAQEEEKKSRKAAQKKNTDKNADRAGAAAAREAYSKEEQDIIMEGRAFISHIHECNDDIEDAEMSKKLNRLEMVVTKIFDQVARKPESAPDLHKMMSYYLPITRKLVDAYRDLDDQPVEGQNISRTKKEIEDSLDTINTAFENLLDSFFQDTAWDISSDISVLHTMMAQDGLMKKDFEADRRINTVAEDFSGKN